MSIAGIICEYNPFHNGHLRQLQWLKEKQGMDVVICALSGHFLQRGEAALTDKWRRTRMALAGGADLVLELPAHYATRSAYWFALGGVTLLAAAGATHLAFGAETDDLPALTATAQHLAQAGPAYTAALHRYLAAGLSFAEARAKALHSTGDRQLLAPALPNDQLALAYLQVIAEKKLPLTPLLLARSGNAYHDVQLPQDPGAPPSATALRRLLLQACSREAQADANPIPSPDVIPRIVPSLTLAQLEALGLAAYMPPAALNCLADAPLVFPADTAPLQLALLRRACRQSLLALPDMTEGLENRVLDCAARARGLTDFYGRLKTKRYPLTRLQRLVCHLLLDYRDVPAPVLAAGPPYLRVLGLNATGRSFLHRRKPDCPLPLITRSRQLKALAAKDDWAAAAWDLELRSTAIYSLLAGLDTAGGNPEYLHSSILWD